MPTADEMFNPESLDVGGLPISSTLTKTPALPTPTAQEGPGKMLEAFASALASFGDAFRQFGGQPAVFQKERREATGATRKAEHEKLLVEAEGRKAETAKQELALSREKFNLEKTKRRDDISQKLIKDASDMAAKSTLSDEDVQAQLSSFAALAEREAHPEIAPIIRKMAANRAIGVAIGPYLDDLDPGDVKLLMAMGSRAETPAAQALVLDRVRTATLQKTGTKLSARIDALSDLYRAEYAQRGEKIPLKLLEANLGTRDAYAQNELFLGVGAYGNKQLRERVLDWVTDAGFEVPGVAAETAKKVGEEEATRPGKVKTAVEIAKGAEEATRPGREQFATDVEKMKRRMEAGSFPDKKEQASLRNQYRAQARLVVEAQYRGPLGQINLTTDEERAAFEKKIEDKAVETANSDGIGFIFPGKKPAVAKPAPAGETLSRKDPRYQQARTVLKLTDDQIEQKYKVKLTD